MRHRPILAAVLLLCLWVDPAVAEIYKWTDEAGRVHFTQDLSQVPAPHRRQAGEQAAKRSTSKSPVQSYRSQPPASQQSSSSRSGKSQPGAGETYSIRVAQAGTSMLVNVRLNNSVTAPFLIDTGASDVVVPEAVAKRLGLELEGARTQRYSTANGVIEQAVVMLRSVALGEAVVKDVPASVSDSMSVGLLGLSFFNHFNYNVDAAKGVVTLTRNDLASTGHIKGGRSQAQWQSAFGGLNQRIQRSRWEYENKSEAKARERRRLEQEIAELTRQLDLLEDEADSARVPMAWRD